MKILLFVVTVLVVNYSYQYFQLTADYGEALERSYFSVLGAIYYGIFCWGYK